MPEGYTDILRERERERERVNSDSPSMSWFYRNFKSWLINKHTLINI